MKKEVAKKWIKALRSGKYKQGQGTLKQYDPKGQAQHCCLGVLCELYNDTMKKNHKKTLPEKFIEDNTYGYAHTKFGNETDVLPSTIKKWAGMKDKTGEVKYQGVFVESLVDLNDSGRQFTTISNFIEKHWENL